MKIKKYSNKKYHQQIVLPVNPINHNLLRQTFSKGGTVQFNVANLHNGIYCLHIYDGASSKPDMQQIVIKC